MLTAAAALICILFASCSSARKPLVHTGTVAGLGKEFGEPFGIAVRKKAVYVSDGETGEIKIVEGGKVTTFARGFHTPSGIAFDKSGRLIVADAGSNSVKAVESDGSVSDVAVGTFRGPTGVAVGDDGRIFVTDTYNDRVSVIDKGGVSPVAGGKRGYADGIAAEARFDTPVGIATWGERLLVADSGNHRIRVIEPDGNVWTLAGNGKAELKDGLLFQSSFVEPTAVVVSDAGEIYVADGNAIRVISGDVVPTVRTISDTGRGYVDGAARRSRFNRPSGLAIDTHGDLLVADAENRVVRSFSTTHGSKATREQIAAMRVTAAEFRELQPARWPFDPPRAARDVAGTSGELRGEIRPGSQDIHFHNGLDIAGAYGETARFVRDEKVLRPSAAANFGTLRELIRMPTLGYIHVRLGRNADGTLFGDPRFIFDRDASGKLTDVRVPRGASFKAGEPVGTLNPMNHIHLIAGRSGSEMNALDALVFPGITDSRPPTVDKVAITDEKWAPFEKKNDAGGIIVRGRLRVVMQAFDQMTGNSERRRLGLYKAGYQVLSTNGTAAGEPQWTIRFDQLPDESAVPLVYAEGSHSGATGETIFRFIVTNRIDGGHASEDFFDTAAIEPGNYILRACGGDYFGNIGCADTAIEVTR